VSFLFASVLCSCASRLRPLLETWTWIPTELKTGGGPLVEASLLAAECRGGTLLRRMLITDPQLAMSSIAVSPFWRPPKSTIFTVLCSGRSVFSIRMLPGMRSPCLTWALCM